MIHLQRELEQLKKQLFHLSSLVEESLKLAVNATTAGQPGMATRIIELDREIDRIEVEVEEECLKILALHQPVAIDLRFLIAALKMNNDLERIGDLAVNIGRGAETLGGDPPLPVISSGIESLGEKARAMLRRSLEALMDMNPDEATAVLAADDEVDQDYYALVGIIKSELSRGSDQTEKLIAWLMIAKHIERVADLATNIAEDTIYTAKGEIIRHGRMG